MHMYYIYEATRYKHTDTHMHTRSLKYVSPFIVYIAIVYRLSINLIAVGAVVYRIYTCIHIRTHIHTYTHILQPDKHAYVHNSVSAYTCHSCDLVDDYILSHRSTTGFCLRAPRKGRSIKCGYRRQRDAHYADASLALSPSGPKAFSYIRLFREETENAGRKHGRVAKYYRAGHF